MKNVRGDLFTTLIFVNYKKVLNIFQHKFDFFFGDFHNGDVWRIKIKSYSVFKSYEQTQDHTILMVFPVSAFVNHALILLNLMKLKPKFSFILKWDLIDLGQHHHWLLWLWRAWETYAWTICLLLKVLRRLVQKEPLVIYRSCEYLNYEYYQELWVPLLSLRVLTLGFRRPSKRMHTRGFYKILFPVLNESHLQDNSEVTKEDILNPAKKYRCS